MKNVSLNTKTLVRHLCLLTNLVILWSCSDGPIGGISGTGKAPLERGPSLIVGRVEAVDQLTIDGITFGAAQSEVTINGNPGVLADVRVGMTVSATVDKDNQIVDSIDYQPLLSGPVASASDDKTTLEILGQTVIISPDTYLDSLTIEDIFQDQVVEINGDRDMEGAIVADYIRVPNLDENYFVIGNIETLETAPATASVSGTQIDLQQVLLNVLDGGLQLVTGNILKAELVWNNNIQSNEPLIATDAEVLEVPGVTDFEEVTVNGLVSDVDDNGFFVLKRFVFMVNDNTVFTDRNSNEIDPVDIRENYRIKATGVSTFDNYFIATHIRIKNIRE